MSESTARAERFERDAAVAPSFTWTVPQKPVAVRIPLTVIEKLEREAVETYRSLTSRGSEIGGLLFGSVTPGSPAMVEIETYETFPCEYAAGPLYHLSPAELARLDRLIEQRRVAGAAPIGFFRSQTRKGLSLDAEDLALLDSRFAGPHEIALLVRPSATKASTGGIFIREDGKIRAEASYLEFPFRASQAESGEKSSAESPVAGPRTVPAAPAAPIAPRPVVRAQIVPIASRREVMPAAMTNAEPVDEPAASAPDPKPAPQPKLAPEPKATPEAKVAPEPKPAPEPKAAPEPKSVHEPKTAPQPKPAIQPKAAPEPKSASDPKTLPEPRPAGSAAVQEAPAVTSAPAPQPEMPSADDAPSALPDEHKRPGKLLWIGLGAAASVILAGGFLLTSGILHRNRTLPVNSLESGLALRVERNAGDILLTWNRDADAIKRASRAVLSIHDGPQEEKVEMDLSQLRTGSIVYSPVTSDVVFQMEVTATGLSQPVAETVRVLRTRPSPMPEQGGSTPATPGAPKSSAPGAAGAPPAAAPGADATVQAQEEKVALAKPVKQFTAESLAQRLRPTRTEEASDAPTVSATAMPQVSDVNLGGIVGTSVAPPPTPAQAPSASPRPAEKKAASGGQIQQAVLLKRRDPDYPKLARDSNAAGVVELVATVGTDGHVKEVKVLRGHPLLRQAAIDAVKQWVYRPTILNGQPVETQTQVLLNFKGER